MAWHPEGAGPSSKAPWIVAAAAAKLGAGQREIKQNQCLSKCWGSSLDQATWLNNWQLALLKRCSCLSSQTRVLHVKTTVVEIVVCPVSAMRCVITIKVWWQFAADFLFHIHMNVHSSRPSLASSSSSPSSSSSKSSFWLLSQMAWTSSYSSFDLKSSSLVAKTVEKLKWRRSEPPILLLQLLPLYAKGYTVRWGGCECLRMSLLPVFPFRWRPLRRSNARSED